MALQQAFIALPRSDCAAPMLTSASLRVAMDIARRWRLKSSGISAILIERTFKICRFDTTNPQLGPERHRRIDRE
jgi:hypothetical protein